MRRKTPIVASNAHIFLVGHITQAELRRNLDETETANGFANRFLWAYTKRSKYLPEGGNLSESDLNGLVMRLRQAVDHAKNMGELQRDEGARALWHRVYARLSDGHAGLLGAVTSRAEAQVMRLACIYALLDCAQEIRRAHRGAALALWQYCEGSARYVFGAATGDKIADEIYRALVEAGADGLTKTNLQNLFGRHQNGGNLTRALNALQELGRVEMVREETEGRPREVYCVKTCEISELSEISPYLDDHNSHNSHKWRYAPVTINNPQQANMATDGGQQVNVAKQD